MPTNSRCRVIREFNQGKWPFLIASECNDIFDDSQEAEENLKGKKNKVSLKIIRSVISSKFSTSYCFDLFCPPILPYNRARKFS